MDMSVGGLWTSMGPPAKGIFILLCILSVYSLAVSVERWLLFQKARQQSVKFALEVGQFLKQDKLKEAIDLAKKYKHSHVAKVLSAGCLLYTSDAADEEDSVDLGGRRII